MSREIEELLGKVALEDRKALGQLYDRCSSKLFGVCLRVLKDRAAAEDAVQESFVKVWRNADRYAVNGLSPMTWLITIARNTAIDALRAQRRAGTSAGLDEVLAMPAPGPSPEAAAVAASEASRIAGCMNELEDDRRAAVRGAYLEGLSYNELAAAAGVPLNTMRTWLRRSLMKLKDCLQR
ncbi:MAG: sigma-70 family RNA polymerase sigma factor [Rhodobacter sp.]|nr:sigma-70 family RNA polymerase sigma factor [Rhodobacter sp.]